MGNTFFVSDTHFNHGNIIKYSNRPFIDVKTMNESLIQNWNSKVQPTDTVYHTGDFGFSSFLGEEYSLYNILRRLNGKKHLILGNHDKNIPKGWDSINNYLKIKVNDTGIILFHFPILSWDKKQYGAWHLHGHVHGTIPDDPSILRVDIGVDALCKKDYAPISYDELALVMKSKTWVSNKDFSE